MRRAALVPDMTGPDTSISEVVTSGFSAPHRPLGDYWWPVRGQVTTGPVRGWLVGVRDRAHWGWWGSITASVASAIEPLFASVKDRTPTSPSEWAQRIRRSNRHAHTGLLSIAVGAFELACWDLVGQKAGVPVWALVGNAKLDRVVTYATCFGFSPEGNAWGSIARAAADIWAVQKWRPPSLATRLNELADAAGGDWRLAIDFGGQWCSDAVRELCRGLGTHLAWIEEPYPPREIHHAHFEHVPGIHAAGEHCYGPAETAILESAGVQIWQPDVVFCGGFTAFSEIVGRAAVVGVRCIPHGGGFIPAVHAAVSGQEIERLEYHVLLEPKRQAHLEFPILPDSRFAMSVPRPELPGWAGPLHSQLRMQSQ